MKKDINNVTFLQCIVLIFLYAKVVITQNRQILSCGSLVRDARDVFKLVFKCLVFKAKIKGFFAKRLLPKSTNSKIFKFYILL